MFYAPQPLREAAPWGVACTCREPAPLVVAFAAHYVALGAREVWLYLDRPQPDLERLLRQIPEVRMQVCDETYWRDHIGKVRPESVEYRQLINVYDAYERSQVDWIAHFDADEFLHCDLPVGDLLSAQPEQIDYVLVEPRERAFVQNVPQASIFDGIFRRPVPLDWGEVPYLFGSAMRFMRQGVLGYPHGKSFSRTRNHVVPGIHSPRPYRDDPRGTLRGLKTPRARLLHFDGLTALHWSAKLVRAARAGSGRRFNGPKSRDGHRGRQINMMRRVGNNLEGAWNMHEMLKCVAPDDVERLMALGLIEEHDIDPARDIARLGLDAAVDLSRAGFDAALARLDPEVAELLSDWEAIVAEPLEALTGT